MKRVISLILCLALTLSLFPAGALAAGEDTPGTLTTGDITLEGTNSMGSLIANSMDESLLSAASDFCSVTGLEMDGATASLQFHTDRPSRIVVAVYTDDDAMQMLGSGTLSVSAEDTAADVTVSIDSMPEYFVVSAYLLDDETLEPLCDRFISSMYTKAAQEFLASTVDDYDAERVVSLDGSDDNNFLVFGENTILSQETAGVNEITDNGDGTYTIRHADETFRSLQPGDSFAYTYASGEMLVVLVESVIVDGDTVTVTAVQDAELADVFDIIKIDTDSFEAGAEDVSFRPGEHVTLLDESELPAMDGAGMDTASYSHSLAFRLDPWGKLDEELEEEEEDDDWPFSGSFTLTGIFSVTVRLQIYESAFWDYYSLTFDNTVTGEIKLSGQVTLAEYNLTELAVLLFGGAVKIGATIKFVVEFEASITFSFTISATIGGAYDSDAGFINLCSWPSWDYEIAVEGSLFIGLKITPSVKLGGDMAGMSIVGTAGVEISAKKPLGQKQDESSSVHHKCYDSCWDGDVHLKGSCTFTVNLIGSILQKSTTIASFKHKLADFYWCSYHERFDWTTCPYIYYKLTVTVLDDLGLPLPGVTVNINEHGTGITHGTETTDNAGRISVYMANGLYDINFSHEGSSVSRPVEILDSAHSITLFKDGTDFSVHYAIASGKFGPDNKQDWLLTTTGVLYLSGEGYIYEEDEYPWSDYNGRIKTLIVDDGLTNIPAGFCENYTNLLSAILPESLITIGDGAFKGCSKLISMILPFIGINRGYSGSADDVFGYIFGWSNEAHDDATAQYYNNSPTSRYYFIPRSLRTVTVTNETIVPTGAFSNCTMLENISINDNVSTVENYAFYNCTGLRDFTMPAETTSVWNYAFYNCPGLLAVGPNVTTVYAHAFSGCTGLTELPDSLTNIADHAFENCTGFTDITVPDSVYFIGDGAFKGCNKLISITLPFIGKNRGYSGSADDVFGYIFGWSTEAHDDATAQYYNNSPTSRYYFIPRSLRTVTVTNESIVPTGAFSNCTMLENVSINDNVSSVEYYAFYNCTGLQDFTMPAETTSVWNYAFYNCPGLLAVGPNVTTVYAHAFSGCTGLTELPDSLTNIADHAFENCTGFTDITVPDSVYFIGDSAFKGCNKLISITLPFIGTNRGGSGSADDVFGYIFGWSNEAHDDATEQYYNNSPTSRYYFIPQSLRTVTVTNESIVPTGAFSNCTMLENVSINDNVSSVEYYAFYNCTGLRDFTMPAETTSVWNYAFYNCPGLLAVGPNVTTVYAHAFSGCTGLTELPDSLTNIADHAFENCTGFTDITVPDSVYFIGDGAFRGCDNLVSVTLPFIGKNRGHSGSEDDVFGYIFGWSSEAHDDATAQYYNNSPTSRYYFIPRSLRTVTVTNETTVPTGAFSNCSMLESVSLNDDFSYIYAYAFYGCDNLTDVWYEGTEEQWNSLYIYDHNDALNSAVIHFPEVAADGIPEDVTEPETTPEPDAAPAPDTLPPAESVTDEAEPLPQESPEPEPTEVPETTDNPETTAEPKPTKSPEPTAEPEPMPETEPVPAAPAELLPVIPAEEIEFVAAYTGVFAMEDTAIATFSDLCPSGSYVFLAVKDGEAKDLTAPENLLYICQGTADESGTLRIAYTPRESADAMDVLAFGAAKNRLEDATFFVNYEDVGGTLFYSSMLIHKGTVLTEGEDYISHITANADGTTTLILTGRDNYSGTVGAMVYAVRFEANAELPAPALQVMNCGDSITLPSMSEAPDDLWFAGWSSNPDAAEAEYAPGALYTAGYDATLYAVWAEEYAILRGDVDIDDTLTIRDATQILRYLATLPSVFGTAEDDEVESARLRAADTDRDGSITDKDAQELLNHILGLPSVFDGK